MTEIEFYKSTAWEKKREYILRRDQHKCRICKRYGRMRSANIVHHRKHLDEFWELRLTDSNLISVCEKCHNKLHPEKGGRRY